MLSYVELHVIQHNNTEMPLKWYLFSCYRLDSDDTSTKLTFVLVREARN